jgi:hypothetical protein
MEQNILQVLSDRIKKPIALLASISDGTDWTAAFSDGGDLYIASQVEGDLTISPHKSSLAGDPDYEVS